MASAPRRCGQGLLPVGFFIPGRSLGGLPLQSASVRQGIGSDVFRLGRLSPDYLFLCMYLIVLVIMNLISVIVFYDQSPSTASYPQKLAFLCVPLWSSLGIEAFILWVCQWGRGTMYVCNLDCGFC